MPDMKLGKSLITMKHLIFFWSCLAVYCATLVYAWLRLPEQVATHFNAGGAPNDWMSRDGFLLFSAGMAIFLTAFFVGLFYSVRFFPPSTLNVPHPEYWRRPENFPLACRKIYTWSFPITGISLLFLAWVNFSILSANLVAGGPRLDMGGFFVAIVFFVGAFLAPVFVMCRDFRIPPAETDSSRA